jgi:cytochrome c oxidase subunit 2
MAITSASERLWWKTPIHKIELIWIVIAFLWGLVMFFMMICWHAVGAQNLLNEAYRTTPVDYAARVYMWWPMLEFEKGASYRLHISSIDLHPGWRASIRGALARQRAGAGL